MKKISFVLGFLAFFISLETQGVCDCQSMDLQSACPPECRLFCSLGCESLQEASDKLKKQCQKDTPEQAIYNGVVPANEIEDTYKLSENQIVEDFFKSKGKTKLRGDCKNCSAVPVMLNNTRPKSAKKGTCKFINDHPILLNYVHNPGRGNCGAKSVLAIYEALDDSVEEILRKRNARGRLLWEQCPDDCSFYVSSASRIDTKKCAGIMVMNVHCNDEKISKGWFGRKTPYNVSISYKTEIECNVCKNN